MTDYPFDEAEEGAKKWMADGFEIHQKFTCVKCGARLTIEEPNVFYTSGSCDKCGAVTDIRARGCNYLAIGAFKAKS
jgi:ribosomal protein L40E